MQRKNLESGKYYSMGPARYDEKIEYLIHVLEKGAKEPILYYVEVIADTGECWRTQVNDKIEPWRIREVGIEVWLTARLGGWPDGH